MTFKEAAQKVLEVAGRPMKAEELTNSALRDGLLKTEGRTPAATMGAQLYTDVRDQGAASPFVQLGKNLWGLRQWDLSTLGQEIEKEAKARLAEQREQRSFQRRTVVGDPINVEGLTYAPLNENGVIYLFAKLAPRLGFIIESIQPAFPDAKGRRRTARGLEDVWIEFEYRASSFRTHGHDPAQCDLIVCWENDWLDAPIEVLALKEVVEKLR